LIFIDGDVGMAATNNPKTVSGWKKLEAFLEEYQPAVCAPDYRSYEPPGTSSYPTNIYPSLQTERPDTMKGSYHIRFVDTNRYATYPMFHWDAIVTAFHHDAADNLFPYEGKWDAESWWYSQVRSNRCES
jgi:hypothetical protein